MRRSVNRQFYSNQKNYNTYQKNTGGNNSKDYYSYGSVAYNPDVYYDDEVEVIRRVRVKERHTQKNYLAIMIIAILIVFAQCTLIMASYAKVQNQRHQNTLLKQELINIENENHIKTAEMQNQISLDYIENEAVNRFNMSKPQDYQIVYINVPEESYTVHFSEDGAE